MCSGTCDKLFLDMAAQTLPPKLVTSSIIEQRNISYPLLTQLTTPSHTYIVFIVHRNDKRIGLSFHCSLYSTVHVDIKEG